jgi:hypothetical protein
MYSCNLEYIWSEYYFSGITECFWSSLARDKLTLIVTPLLLKPGALPLRHRAPQYCNLNQKEGLSTNGFIRGKKHGKDDPSILNVDIL